jgi:hypothetical protein
MHEPQYTVMDFALCSAYTQTHRHTHNLHQSQEFMKTSLQPWSSILGFVICRHTELAKVLVTNRLPAGNGSKAME